MGKFSEALGILQFKIKETDVRLVPVAEDVLKAIKMANKFKDMGTDDKVVDNLFDFVYTIFKRSYPDENQEEVKSFVAANLVPITQEIMVGFRFTTKAEIEKRVDETKK